MIFEHTVVVPAVTVSTANKREHYHAKASRVRGERLAAALSTYTLIAKARAAGVEPLPCTITLTRRSPRLLDDDNLRPALKAWRDGVADRLRLKNDRDPRVRWEYAQQTCKGWAACAVCIKLTVDPTFHVKPS